jgi:hypothetical protein
MTIPTKPTYSHGSTGTAPSSAIDYANGDPLNADELDYYLHVEFAKIKALIDWAESIDTNDDGKVDAADSADVATNVTSTYKGNDLDSDADGKVDAAETADSASTATTADTAGTVTGTDGTARLGGQLPQYQSKSAAQNDADVTEGTIVYIQDQNQAYIEDGT